MRERLLRIVLLAQALGAAVIGFWALGWPRSFYDSFPGGGRAWVSADGPFNEHLVRDVGALNLALLVMTIAAAWRLTPTVVRAASLATLVFAVPHFIYHADHIDTLSGSDQPAELMSLGSSIVLALVALWLARSSSSSTDRRP